MKYISTRDNSKEYSFEEVFIKGLADDGGLFIPREVKRYSQEELESLNDFPLYLFDISRSYNGLIKNTKLSFLGF